MYSGYCSRCRKAWTSEAPGGVCQWCGLDSIRLTGSPGRSLKATRRPQPAELPKPNGYEHLAEPWLSYYKVAIRYAKKSKPGDYQDLLHDTIITLAEADRKIHGELSEAVKHRIASHANHHYWYKHYNITTGLDCGHCSTTQRHKCRKDWSYPDCPKAIRIDSLSKPIIDSYGRITELGELITDDKAIDLDTWGNTPTWEIGWPQRLVQIAYKLKDGDALSVAERKYLYKCRKKEQKSLI